MALDDRDAVAELLGPGLLGGREVAALSLEFDDREVLMVECAPDEVLPAWRAARAVLDETGRWPVVVAGWDDEGLSSRMFSRFPYDHGTGGDHSPSAVCSRAELVDPDAAIEELRRQDDAIRWDGWPSVVQGALEYTAHRYGTAPSAGELSAALGDDPGLITLDRWLFEWEQEAEACGVQPAPPTTWHQDWFVPTGMPCGVVLLPTPHGWQVPAWLSFFGAEGAGGHERLIAVLRRWHDQWGAELVAHWGTMLQFVVERPPTTASDAYELALAHELLAGATLVLAGVSVREHVRALVNRGTWFLHDRP